MRQFMTRNRTLPHRPDPERERWLDAIVSVQEGAQLRSVSVDSLKRHSPDKLIRVSARRLGIRRRHALMLED